MDLTPEELAKRKMQLRPSEKPETKEAEPQAPKPQGPKFEPETPLTPEERAKKALGLDPRDPTPDPKNLSPQMQQSLLRIDPELQRQILGVMGCLQHMQDKTQALAQKVQQDMAAANDRVRKTSFAQRLVIRRAHNGDLTSQDMDLARSIIAKEGKDTAIDPRKEGIATLMAQREELMGAAREMHASIVSQMPQQAGQADEQVRALAFVDMAVSQEAAATSSAVDGMWAGYKQSDLERIRTIVEERRTIENNGPHTQQSPQGR